ncbi:Com family DNA-binding transcriptional regulator [Pseudazoarcus pumilus]|uniref:Com family DNA-binding transcriptional regulator n=1 Tax=Pseudazoarcus pumilus TaxID=2067960 RepID=A0A2I6S9D6_9RHOO|nr:Com family DNA-binding transcriptional regulator [Pseudazoarcus pumilus]AUN95865.1 Com family DNA-binding transcriptional regulator [Pseudazoarcus pumilus]
MKELRCGNCHRLLARGQPSNIEIKCPRCGHLNLFNNPKAVEPPNPRDKVARPRSTRP